MTSPKEKNFAFIDSQNLNLGIKSLGWSLDFRKFRIYLKEKYKVDIAYVFIGFLPENQDLYSSLQNYGYNLVFKPVVPDENGKPKGNVDADLVLKVMKEWNNFDKAVIVSSDGDFYSLVDHLFKEEKLKIVLSPYYKNCSTLLKKTAKGKLACFNKLKDRLRYLKRQKKDAA